MFTVPCLPPKKDGASSMWRKDPEVDRVIALRLAAEEVLGGRPLLARDIRLSLTLHLARNDRSVGDLDNFITGVLDGLQVVHPNTPWDREPRWADEAVKHVQPNAWAMITDDVEVVEIIARKVVGDVEAGEEWYEIRLEERR